MCLGRVQLRSDKGSVQPLPGDRLVQGGSSGGLPPPREGDGGPGIRAPSPCSCLYKLPPTPEKGESWVGPDRRREQSRGLGGSQEEGRAEGSGEQLRVGGRRGGGP